MDVDADAAVAVAIEPQQKHPQHPQHQNISSRLGWLVIINAACGINGRAWSK